MYELFLVSLICLCVASVGAFIIGFKNHSWILAIFVPVITLCGSFAYFSYVSVLGYPVELSWEQMPERFTVIYFKIENKENIHLWLLQDNTTRHVTLPYIEPVEEVLEQGRGSMGKGIPVTLKRVAGGKSGQGKGVSGDGEGQGEGGDGDGDGKQGKGNKGWRYIIDSFGEPIGKGKLPPKF